MRPKALISMVGCLLVMTLILCLTHAAVAAEAKGYVWSTVPPGGTIYITTNALASVTSDVTGMKSFVETAVNLDVAQMDVHLKKADFVQSGFPRVVRGYEGTFPAYKGKASNNIRLVMFGPLTKTPWFSMKRYSNVTSWDQMKGKKILGGVTQMYLKFADATLKYHKVRDQVKELRMGVGTDDLVHSMTEGRVDACFGWTGTMMYDFHSAGGYNIIEQPAEEVNTIIQQFDQKGWVPVLVKKGEFGASKDYQTAAIPVALLAGIHVPKDVVYQIVKAIMSNQEKLAKIHEKAGEFDKEDVLVGLGCPIHPGAKQYFKEHGMWTSDLEAENQKLLKMYDFKE